MTIVNRAWMLDPIEFHLDLLVLRHSPDGLVAVRDAALRVWDSPDPVVRGYLEVLPVGDPEQWRSAPDVDHLVDWYRMLMGPYLIPTRAFAAPDVLRRRLPDLGWPAAEARRLARGRDLLRLVEEHAGPALAQEMSPHVRVGDKGWLHHDDLLSNLERMRRLDRAAFRHHQDMVPVVEDAFEVLEAAATKPDHVLLLVVDCPNLGA